MLKSIGSAIGLGLYWFLIGTFIGFTVFEGLIDPDGKIADVWPAVLGLPAFFGGVTFFTMTRILKRHGRLHELSLSRGAVCGALTAPVLSAMFVLGMTTGVLGDFKGNRTPWLGIAQVTGIMIPAFTIAGCFSVWMAKQVAASHGTLPEAGTAKP